MIDALESEGAGVVDEVLPVDAVVDCPPSGTFCPPPPPPPLLLNNPPGAPVVEPLGLNKGFGA